MFALMPAMCGVNIMVYTQVCTSGGNTGTKSDVYLSTVYVATLFILKYAFTAKP